MQPQTDPSLSCQISYLPLGTDQTSAYVNEIIKLIADSGLDHEVGAFATVIGGKHSALLALIADILQVASRCNFVLDIRISNTCGCRTEQ